MKKTKFNSRTNNIFYINSSIPIDYSYMEIKDLQELLLEIPR